MCDGAGGVFLMIVAYFFVLIHYTMRGFHVHVLVIMRQVSMLCPLQNFPATIWLIPSSQSSFNLSSILPCAVRSLHLRGTLGPSPSRPFPPIPDLGRSGVIGSCVSCLSSLSAFGSVPCPDTRVTL